MEYEKHSYVLKNTETGLFYTNYDAYDGYYMFDDFLSEYIHKWDKLSDVYEYIERHETLKNLKSLAVCDYTMTIWVGNPI